MGVLGISTIIHTNTATAYLSAITHPSLVARSGRCWPAGAGRSGVGNGALPAWCVAKDRIDISQAWLHAPKKGEPDYPEHQSRAAYGEAAPSCDGEDELPPSRPQDGEEQARKKARAHYELHPKP